MKKIVITGSLSLIFALCGLPVQAQTPDGQTPVNEAICDPLRVDGVTKGLYGLCVAFCEAQDVVVESDPITEAELDAIAASAPSGRILANYNNKKQAGDPAMPCIVVEEACPCWTSEEIASIDGLHPDAYPIAHVTARDNNFNVAHWEGVNDFSRTYQFVRIINRSDDKTCIYQNKQTTPDNFQRISELDDVQVEACLISIEEHILLHPNP